MSTIEERVRDLELTVNEFTGSALGGSTPPSAGERRTDQVNVDGLYVNTKLREELEEARLARDNEREEKLVWMKRVHEQDEILFAKRTTPTPGVVSESQDTLEEVVRFLLGETSLRGSWFGDAPVIGRGSYWWRKDLRAAFDARITPTKPAAEGEGT